VGILFQLIAQVLSQLRLVWVSKIFGGQFVTDDF